MDYKPALDHLAKAIGDNNRAKGFRDKPMNVGEVLMLITSELGEALEAHRHDRFTQRTLFEERIRWEREARDLTKDIGAIQPSDEELFNQSFRAFVKDSFEDEIADAFIRILDLCERMQIDIAWHVQMKMKYNAGRPYKHGKAY